jgi:hypothetical protein
MICCFANRMTLVVVLLIYFIVKDYYDFDV